MSYPQISRGLGWFSLGLGLTQLLAPDRLGRLVGVGERTTLMRTMGLREIAHGAAILAPRQPKAGVWSRVAGDALDAGLLVSTLGGTRTRRSRVLTATAMVAAVGVLDLLCALKLTKRT